MRIFKFGIFTWCTFISTGTLPANELARELDSPPPNYCDIRTQFLCILGPNDVVELSDNGAIRSWMVKEPKLGDSFFILENKSCSEFARGNISVKSLRVYQKQYPKFLFDSYYLDSSRRCVISIGYQFHKGKPMSVSEYKSMGQVKLCTSWKMDGCKGRTDFHDKTVH